MHVAGCRVLVRSEPALDVLESVPDDKPGTQHPGMQFYVMLLTSAVAAMSWQVRTHVELF